MLPPLFWPVAGWVLGIALGRMEAVSFLVVALGLLLALCWQWRRPGGFPLALALGLAWGGASFVLDASQTIAEPRWQDRELHIEGTLSQLRNSHPTRLRLQDIVLHDEQGAHALRGRIDAYRWRGKTSLHVGDRIRFRARLHAPSAHGNPGGFDYLAYCQRHHIRWIAQVRGDIEVLHPAEGTWSHIRQRLREAMPQAEAQAGVLRALLLAERDAVPMAVDDAFAASGTAHLLAISGLHIGMLAAWGGTLAWWLLTRREAWIVAVPVRRCAMLAGVMAAAAYATLAGWPLPTQRAFVMLLGAMLAWWWRRRYPPLNILLLALMFILFLDPAAVSGISLWLSFGATSALLLTLRGERAGKGNEKLPARLWRALRMLLWVSLIATLATLPIVVGVFSRLPVWSLPANLLLVPLYGLWVLPLSLLDCLLIAFGGEGGTLLRMAGWGVEAGNAILFAFLHAPAGNFWVARVGVGVGAAYMLGMACALWMWRRGWKARSGACAFSVLLAYLFIVVPEHPPGDVRWIAWDVGQGAASSLLSEDGRVLIVDVPGRKGSRFNGGTTVAAGLRHMGVTHADLVCISHAQSDHGGGLSRLLSSLRQVRALCLADVPANRRWPPLQQAIRRIQGAGGHVYWLARGDRVRWAGLDISVLWPPRGFDPTNGNLASLVLSLPTPDGERLLLPGDIEAPVERALLRQGISKHAMMLVPHHGSRTSSTKPWLRALRPSIAVVQRGLHNRWRFPAPEVVARYRSIGARVDDTAHGAWEYRWSEGVFSSHQHLPPTHEKYRQAQAWWRSLSHLLCSGDASCEKV